MKKLAYGIVLAAAVALGAASAEAGTFIRFSISAVRNTAGVGLQMSELAVYNKLGNRVNLNLTKSATSGATAADLAVGEFLVSHEATNASGLSPKMFDGDLATKYYRNYNPTAATPIVITMRLADGTEIGGYNFCTADDVSNRDPVSWKVETSDNGSDWKEVDSVADFVPTTTRKTWYDGLGGTSGGGSEITYFVLSPFKIDPIPDQFLFMDPVTPEPVVTDRETGDTLVKDVHYTVSYTDNDKGGFGGVTVTGKDGSAYAGESTTALFNVYRRVKSITSTGTQYIDTGIVPGDTTAVEMYFNTTNCANNTALFGAGAYSDNNSYCFYQGSYYYFRGASETAMGMLPESELDAYVSISTNAADNCFVDISGNAATKTVSLTYTGANSLNVFATNVGNSKSKFTLYSFKIWQDGELVRDFVPVRGGSDACLYDLVTSSFFKNAGTGTFLAGPDETDIAVAKIPNQFCTGAALTPSVVVSNLAGTALLVKDVDYTVAYENNAAVGKGMAIVTGMGAYTSVVTNEFTIYSLPAPPAFTSKSYVQHGLMNQWDAVDNAGTGLFDPAAKIWKDLKGDLDFYLTDRAQWNGGFLETTGYAGAAKAKTGMYVTIEIKHRTTKRRYSIPFASGYSLRHLVWYKANNSYFDFYPWHENNVAYNFLTGRPYTGTTDKNMSIVYGSAGGSNSPMLFYQDGTRITSGISNSKMWWPGFPFVSSFPTAVIGAANASQYNFEGRLYTIRLYDCPLTDEEIAYNAAVDKVRFEGVAPADAFNSSNMRWNATSGKVEVLIDLGTVNDKGAGSFSVNGGGASEWVAIGDEVKAVYAPAPGEKALAWVNLPVDTPCSSDLFTITFTAESPVSARMQMRKPTDLSRALNADPGIEEGLGSFNDGANRSFMPVSWNRVHDRAGLGSHGTTSDERGWFYLRPYQGNKFFQQGLALPAGSYTLTFDHAADATEHTIHAFQLINTNDQVQSICAATNEIRVLGDKVWHTIQSDFTVAEDGIYTLNLVGLTGGNCYADFDNISITSDTDLHIEVEKCYPFFGEQQVRPPVVVRDDDGNVLTEGVDYELLYGANNSAGVDLDSALTLRHGNGYVAAKGIGSHYGVAGANFRLGTPIFVKPDGLPTNGGTSWNDAVDFATALTLAATPHANSEIWIAGSNVLSAAATSQLFYGNKIFRGGFKGTETTIEERESDAYSVIDGDGQFSAVVFRMSCNAYFERLHFRGSPNRAISKTNGGGSVFIDDCVFEDNGNAVYVQGIDRSPYCQGAVYVTDSVFRNNSSTDDANGAAAVYTYQTRKVSAENTLFATNTLATSSKIKASAVLAQKSAVELKECDFVANVGDGATYGTVCATGSDAKDIVENCLFRGNRADGANAASIRLEHVSLMTPAEVVNCTFAANANSTAGGCAGVKGIIGIVNVRNSIFFGNGVDFADHANCPFVVDYTLLADDTGATYDFANAESKLGETMVYGDPLFAAADDCHLLSEAGYFDSEGNIHYAATDVRSPAIDAGDPESDYSRESAFNGGCVNLGRYGNTPEASRTPSAAPAVDGAPTVAWNDPDGYSMPTVSFTMGGSGSYNARGTIYVSTDNGSTWEDVSGVIGGLSNGQTREFVVPVYYVPGDTILVKVSVTGAGQTAESTVASVEVSGSLPPWYGKKGPENVIHVRPGAIGKNDGTSWTDAFSSWAEALEVLSGTKNEIWVAGTNLVTETMATQTLLYEATIRGGFRGWEESASERPEGRRSVIDGKNKFACFMFFNRKKLLIERMEFRHGGPRGIKKTGGEGDVVLVDCVFAENGATSDWGYSETSNNTNYLPNFGGCGAAFYGTSAAKLMVANCLFENNTSDRTRASSSWLGCGGGALVRSLGSAAFVDCVFRANNAAPHRSSGIGSALGGYDTRLFVTNCLFEGHNDGEYTISTSGMSFLGPSEFVNCRFTGNGGVIRCTTYENAATANHVSNRFENCTFAYNTGTVVGDAYNANKPMDNKFRNCIFWGNTKDIALTKAVYSVEVEWSLLASTNVTVTAGSVTFGDGIVTNDPQFVTIAEEAAENRIGINVHLRGGVGYFDETTGEHKFYPATHRASPAIDAGDPASDFSNEPDCNIGYHGKRVNLGAYGNTPWATMTARPGFFIVVR